MVGAIGAAVNLGTLTLLLSYGVNKYMASPISIEVSIISNFLFHQYWTFADRRSRGAVWIRGLKFKTVALAALGVSYGTFVLISWTVPVVPPHLAQAAAILPGTLVNYLCNSHWTFRGRQEAGPRSPLGEPASR